MGPHNVTRPSTSTVNFTDDTLVQPPPSPAVQARNAFNHTFGTPSALTVQNPFSGMTQAPANPTPTPQTGFEGLGSPGTGRIDHHGNGIVRERIQTYSMMNPSERSNFFNRNRRSDLAHLTHGATSHAQQRDPASLGQLHARHTHSPVLHAANSPTTNRPGHAPIHGRPRATTGRTPQTRPQPSVHIQHTGMTLEYAPQGTRRHTATADVYTTHITPPAERSPRPMQHAPTSSRAERHAEVQAQVAEVRANLALARSDVLSAGNNLFRPSDRQQTLQRAEANFARAQQGLRALQSNPNLTRTERLEVSRLARDNNFRTMNRDISDARLNLELDNI